MSERDLQESTIEESEAAAAAQEGRKPRKVDRRNKLNDLSAKEWIRETVSVWNQRGLGANHPDAAIERLHPAPFSFTDVSRLIRFFTKRDEVVLDPFVGVGSTLKACALEGRKGIGFELNPTYVQLTWQRLQTELGELPCTLADQVTELGDARELVPQLPANSIDFIVTSPPYWNILEKQDHKVLEERVSRNLDTKYSTDPRDLGNITDYDDFLSELAQILGSCVASLKPRKYLALIVGDFRAGSRYVMFHSDIANALIPFGLALKGVTVDYQRHKRVYPYGYPYAYVPNIHNQFIVIMQNENED